MQAVKTAVNGAADKVAASTIGNAKQRQLNGYTVDAGPSDPMTTYWGTKIDKTDVSVKAGSRGPAIVSDFHAREKIQNLDHERIPERAIHARGAGAHGVFRLKKSLSDVTTAKVLSDVGKETPVFVRFSTVSGSRGSADTVRDVRGFAIKFYTEEGNWDLVGNNIPIFFIQDSIQFPDLVHAVKPSPSREMPQAQTAHDNAWDFMSLNDGSVAMMMWIMSGRTIPRNFATMPGFGVHTFAFVNEEGKRTFVKFTLKPRSGTHSNVWTEALSLAGNDPDFHRRTLYTQIDNGAYPTWDFCVQLLEEEREHEFDFDILDSTKFWPEELVPSTVVGELELNRNVTNYFSETEQVAFCTQHVVPGIQFTDDPLLAWRNFSYQDTQISRLGGMNFHEIPINQPIGRCPVMNNLRDGAHRMTIPANDQAYYPNRFSNNHPAGPGKGVFTHYPAPVEGLQERLHSEKFRNNHYSQATLFYNSMHPIEKENMISAFQFELGKCDEEVVQQNTINRLNKVDHDLAVQVASAFDNITAPDEEIPNHGKRSDYLSQIDGKDQVFTAKGRQVGIFVLPGFSGPAVSELKAAFLAAGVVPMIVGPSKGTFEGYDTQFTFETCRSGLFDGLVFIGANDDSEDYVNKLRKLGKVRFALIEGYAHKKPIMLHGNTIKWGTDIALPGEFTPSAKEGSGLKVEKGVIFTPSAGTGVQMASTFLDLLAKHRVWDRETDHLAA